MASYGGAIGVNGSISLNIHSCSFLQNIAESGGAIQILMNVTAFIDTSLFKFNYAVWGGALQVQQFRDLYVQNSIFENNSVIPCEKWEEKCMIQKLGVYLSRKRLNEGEKIVGFGGGISATYNGKISINNCTFIGHDSHEAAAFGANVNITFSILSSTFQFNTCTGSCISSVQNEDSKILNSTLTENQSLNSGILVVSSINWKLSRLEIRGCNFYNNSAKGQGFGSAIVVYEKIDLFIYSTRFHSNSAVVSGSVLTLHGSSVYIYHSNFSYNMVEITGASLIQTITHGLVGTETGNVILVYNCLFEGNHAHGYASKGMITIRSGRVIVHKSSFIRNQAMQGAVIGAASTNVTISDSYFYKNKASLSGGVIDFDADSKHTFLEITNSTFEMNEAQFGSVIYADLSPDISIDSTTFIDNKGKRDRALYLKECLSLRTAYTSFETENNKIDTSYIYLENTQMINTIYRTYRTSFDLGNTSLQSSTETFENIAMASELIFMEAKFGRKGFVHDETPFATGNCIERGGCYPGG